MLTSDNTNLMLSMKIDVRSFLSFLSFPYQTWDQKEAGLAIRVTCQASLQLRLPYKPEAQCHVKAASITERL